MDQRQPPPQQAAPKAHTLSGKEYQCYRAGTDMGTHHGYADSARNLRAFKRHLELELIKLQQAMLQDQTYPMPEDHPLYPAVQALPTLAGGVESVAQQLDAQASKHQVAGSQLMGKIALMEKAQESRWKAPMRAWALLALTMSVATTVATLAATYAIRAGW